MINEESSDSSISDFEENDLNIVEDEYTSSNESEECKCIGNCNCDYKEINTIQEDDEIKRLSDLIGRVEDTELRKMYLERLKEQLGMNPDKRIVIPRPILPSSSSSSPRTPTQNRFAPLIPTYSSITRPRNRPPYSPLAHLQEMPSSPSINPYNRSPTSVSSPIRPKSPSINTEVQFHTNHHKQTIKILEPFEEQKLNQGFPVLLEYLWPKNTNFYTNDFQTREYYEMILIDTGSIQVKHNFDPNDSKVIKFSKVKINKILSPEDWGNRAFTIKVLSKFPEWPGYTYHDYIEAWNKAFLLRV
ncbi:hypothetical protein Tco_0711888 [Tanacetum coccineum]